MIVVTATCQKVLPSKVYLAFCETSSHREVILVETVRAEVLHVLEIAKSCATASGSCSDSNT